jgi:5-methylcytosine-specific restriction enzyme B
MSDLDPRVEESLRGTHDALEARGQLLSTERMNASYAAFRSRFGPDVLKSLDGAALLNTMHAHGNKESLVYWLEFKNDEEFPGPAFGSIAGGSAHKFGLFRRKETGQWVTGAPGYDKILTEPEAITLARKHRDQLLLGGILLEAIHARAGDEVYLALQKNLEKEAPDICGLAWAHKYWCLLFPEKLDDFHNERFQRHNLLRLLITPPEHDGLYVCAGRFTQLAANMGWPVNHLTSTLNERNGPPVRYWRVGTRLGGGEGDFIWPAMRDGAYAAIGWPELGDLTALAEGNQVKNAVRQILEERYPGDARNIGRKAGEIRDFIARMQDGDVVLAGDGERVIGIGHTTGPYRFEDSEPAGAPHRRAVEWDSTDEWKLPIPAEGLRTTFFSLGKHPDNIVAIERRLLGDHRPVLKPAVAAPTRTQRLDGIPGRIQAILERKGQAIVYGPPGTGKTYWARRIALDLAAITAFGRFFSELTNAEREDVEGTGSTDGLVRWCTFHPAYGYEDFIEGFRPQESAAKQLVFERRSGKKLCVDASRAPSQKKFFLIIDEINRGDIPRIFGELLTLLEKDKRGLNITLPVSGEKFSIPANVQVLGTMNTADRSIALLDTALRRRFGFVELMPDATVLGTSSAGDSIPLGPWLNSLNDRLREHLGRDARNLQIGHAYLLDGGRPITDFAHFVRVLREDIIPLLEEYCYEDYGALARILGPSLVDEGRQCVRDELFQTNKWPELVQALLELAPEIVTSRTAVAAAEEQEPEELVEAEEPQA